MSHLVAIVGRPNVGKSTLFNRLIGTKQAILSEVPGTTRDVLFSEVTWNRLAFTIADTAGIELDDKSQLAQDVLLQTKVALNSADLVLFMVDAKEGLNPEDVKAAKIIRKLDKPVVLLVNKTDTKSGQANVNEFHSLGFKNFYETSGLSGKGVGDVLDSIVKQLREIKKPKVEKKKDKEIIKVAIIGRPNVGKSTLFNKLIGKKRSVVSKIPGTTRDTINEQIEYLDKIIEFIDTAGLRRRGKIEQGIEKFSSLRVLRSIQQADICLLVTEADKGVVAQDMHIMQMILESLKGTILVINKWDLIDKTHKITAEFDKYLDSKYAFATWMPRVYISALTGQRVDKLLEQIAFVWQARNLKISTKDLNRLIAKAVSSQPPKGRRTTPKFYYSSQRDVNPPVFELKVNRPEEVHFSYLRYLEKQIRNVWDFTGTPIKIVLKKSSNK
ncbi:ribosome biogenesis GTPase Der [candidate division Kazan bacterium]|uniref:GTPase Der n=1 Tax=candidate division Kazan bacterium TaxID=2202143 RepID=A0A420ZE16_UNCK3|nr:MAG: ribosome biogenesis GTPase Der [candidate division Kazan bacterium]